MELKLSYQLQLADYIRGAARLIWARPNSLLQHFLMTCVLCYGLYSALRLTGLVGAFSIDSRFVLATLAFLVIISAIQIALIGLIVFLADKRKGLSRTVKFTNAGVDIESSVDMTHASWADLGLVYETRRGFYLSRRQKPFWYLPKRVCSDTQLPLVAELLQKKGRTE